MRLYKGGVRISFDPDKDAANRRKDGISLSRAEDFVFETAYIEMDDREDYGELRLLAIGFIVDRLYTLIFTEREDIIRAISLRMATRHEEFTYDNQ